MLAKQMLALPRQKLFYGVVALVAFTSVWNLLAMHKSQAAQLIDAQSRTIRQLTEQARDVRAKLVHIP